MSMLGGRDPSFFKEWKQSSLRKRIKKKEVRANRLRQKSEWKKESEK